MKHFLLAVFLIFSLSTNADINRIPAEELSKIRCLFDYLCCEHDFAFVIFGTKPMSLADICLETFDIPMGNRLYSQFSWIPNEKLKTWRKYKHEFKLNEFILLDSEENLFEYPVIVIIHKVHMLRNLQIHEAIFKEVLGDSFNPQLFLDKIAGKESSLAQAIQHHYGLLGIMLGYGERNSMLFHERMMTLNELTKHRYLLSNNNKLEERLQALDAQFQDFSAFEEFPMVRPLYFGADLNHPETIELKRRYEIDRRQIEELKRSPNFIEQVLQRLAN